MFVVDRRAFPSHGRRETELRLLADMGALNTDVHRIQRLASRHVQPISLGATEAQVGADFRQQDHANALAAGREDLNAVITGSAI